MVKQSKELYDNNENINEGYEKEYNFYLSVKGLNLDIPKVVFSEKNNEYGYIIAFPFYESINYAEWNNVLQHRAIDLIAKLHSIDIEKISQQLNIHYKKVQVNENKLKGAMDEWTNVLTPYSNEFDISQIQLIYNNLGSICDILNSGKNCVCHGDFHADNILFDKDKIILIDWQNISIGKGASDISFFISRGRASGLIINEDEIIDYYSNRIYYYTGVHTEKEEIYRIINASNVFVSFMYWAFYLKGADVHSVCGIYDKMINSFRSLQI